MCKAVKCPKCGHEFTPERAAVKTGAWTTEEDELLLHGYQKERKTIAQLSAFYALGKQLLNARQNKRAIAPLFAELQKLVDTYENF